ncbi:MAG: tyrosine-type recombinase/integrase [Actinomycetota bacterium]
MHTTTIVRAKAMKTDSFGQLVRLDADPHRQQLTRAIAGFLAGYCGQTMTACRIDLTKFIDWLENRSVAVFDAERAHIELYARWSETQGLAPAIIGRRLSTICGFYTYCTEECLLERNPAAHVLRPKQNYESSILGLDCNELSGFLVQAGLCGGRDHAPAYLLALNGLRISEALGADISDLDQNRGQRTLFVRRQGGKTATIPLAPRTARALDLYIDERAEGPILMNHDMTKRLDRHAATRIVKRLAKAAGIDKRTSQHSLRHSFITAALDAGVPLRDVQEAASHAHPRTTMRYDRGRGSLDRHATYIVATLVAGASRGGLRQPHPSTRHLAARRHATDVVEPPMTLLHILTTDQAVRHACARRRARYRLAGSPPLVSLGDRRSALSVTSRGCGCAGAANTERGAGRRCLALAERPLSVSTRSSSTAHLTGRWQVLGA